MLMRKAVGVGACAVLWMLGGVVTLCAEVLNPNGVAVIIGNKTYKHDRVPGVSFADRDAAAFKRYVLDVLGIDEANVIELHDATQADMETAFGNVRDHEGKLWRYLDPAGGSDVVVFYSGHGVPGLKDQRGYLLPTNGDPETAQINGYPIDLLYEILGKLQEARTMTVYLDACFSGDSHKGMLIGKGAKPVYVLAELPEGVATRMTVLTAASGTELASWDEEAGHGLFTNHLLDALYGNGDADGDGQVTAGEVESYLKQHMTKAARRRFGRHQNAGLRGLPDTVLARAVNGVFPDRPELGPVAPPSTDPGLPGEHELELWNDTKNSNNPADFEVYLRKYPNGSFTLLAHLRLDQLEEKALNLNASERRLIVMGLSAAGYQPGVADGTLGTHARAAIRLWQAARGDPQTGSVNADTLEALVALGVGPLVENALNLDREQRRVIERVLAAEGYDPGPVDGDFGQRTREAIGRWQAARREPTTGYLDADAAKILLDSETAAHGQPLVYGNRHIDRSETTRNILLSHIEQN